MTPWKFVLYAFTVMGIATLINIGIASDDNGNGSSNSSRSGSRSWSSGSSGSSGGWSFGGGHK